MKSQACVIVIENYMNLECDLFSLYLWTLNCEAKHRNSELKRTEMSQLKPIEYFVYLIAIYNISKPLFLLMGYWELILMHCLMALCHTDIFGPLK